MCAFQGDKVIGEETYRDDDQRERSQAHRIATPCALLPLDFVVEIDVEWHGTICAGLPRRRRRLH